MSQPPTTMREEWAAAWHLPVIGLLGLTGSTIFAYSSGILMVPMIKEFGWTRAAFSGAFAVQMLASIVIFPIIGVLTDRFGARRVVMAGGLPFVLAFGLLGTVGAPLLQWYALGLLMAMFQSCLATPVIISAVVGPFERSRGLAMAVTLSGLSLGTLIWPIIAAFFVQHIGWRLTFPALSLTWAIVVLPLIILFFRPPLAIGKGARPKIRHGYSTALKSPLFVGLMVAGGLFSCGYYGCVVHLVPILTSSGISLSVAASVASIVGLFAVIGRFCIGFLLDRLSPRLIAVSVLLLPAVSVAFLTLASGSLTATIIAVAILGLSSGAELDILSYFASRILAREVFASVFGLMNSAIAICAGVGPLAAGAIFDHNKSYTLFLILVACAAFLCAGLMMLLPMSQSLTRSVAEGEESEAVDLAVLKSGR